MSVFASTLLVFAGAAFANSQALQTASASNKTELVAPAASDAGASAQAPAAEPVRPVKKSDAPPLAGWGQSLNRKGITPVFNIVQFWLGDPKMGQDPGNWEELTLLTVGADLDMHKLIGYKGASFHFTEMLVPTTHNTAEYGDQVGDEILGQPGPFIPEYPHLTRMTWEEKAFKNKLDLEFGKANAGTWYIHSVCLVDFACQSALAQYDGGFGQGPTPYANWLVRAAYNITPALTVQVSEYRETATFPWSDGWEIKKTGFFHGARPDSNVYMADATYRTDLGHDRYAKNYEFAYAHNTALQNRELSTGGGFTNPVKDQHHGTDIIFAAGRQVIHRFDTPGPAPKPLSVYGQLTQSLDTTNVTGLLTDFKAGVISEGFVKGHPPDGVSLKFTMVRSTENMLAWENTQNIAYGGTGFKNGRNEYGLGAEAFLLFKYMIAMPFAQRVWNPNTMMNPNYGGQTKAGWGFGTMLVFPLDGILGLAGGPH
jgi:porin